jgi:hypothetical protein
VTLIINDTQHNGSVVMLGVIYAECHYAEWHVLFVVMLNVVMLNVVMLNVIMLSGTFYLLLG